MVVRKIGVLTGLLLALALTTTGKASLIFDSGAVPFVASGTQFGRISRDGVASEWGSTKAFPGVIGAPTARSYELFTVDSGVFPFLQVTLDDPTASLFVAAFLSSYNPVNVAPNFGLDVNYLGDPGVSGNPNVFRIEVAPHTQVVLPINEVNPGGGVGQSIDLKVEGFQVAPEPSTIVFATFALAGLLACGWRRKQRR